MIATPESHRGSGSTQAIGAPDRAHERFSWHSRPGDATIPAGQSGAIIRPCQQFARDAAASTWRQRRRVRRPRTGGVVSRRRTARLTHWH